MSDRQEFERFVETVKTPKLSIARRIRLFWDELFHSKALQELNVLRLEVKLLRRKDSELVQVLRDDNKRLRDKIDKLELAVWPLSSRAGQAYAASMTPVAKPLEMQQSRTTWEQLVADRIAENDALDKQEAAKKN